MVACAGWLAWAALLPVNPGETKFVLLRPGWSTRHIAQTLQHEGIIRSAPAFLAVALRAGPRKPEGRRVQIRRSRNALEVRDRVLRGDVFARTVVVPEGYNIYDIAAVGGTGRTRNCRGLRCRGQQ